MIYLLFIVPMISATILICFFKKQVTWWELGGLLGISILFILLAKLIAVSSLTDDIEYLGGYVVEVRYYEDWDEYIHQTCQSCTGTGKDEVCTTYDCSYVDYHPAYWEAITTLGEYTITQAKYNKLVKQFGVREVFKDLHRDYHHNDGDMYACRWQGDDRSLEPVTQAHRYENRPKASANVFKFERPDTSEINMYKLFNYPQVYDDYRQINILGYDDQQAERKLQILNARLGMVKQVRVYILVFRNQPREAAFVQEKYWEGGNKNEFVICIGIDDTERVQWSYEFSWTDIQDTKVETRTYIEAMHKLNLSAVVDYAFNEMAVKFERKKFHDFDYLHIDPTLNQIVWILALVILINAGSCYWIVTNEFTP